MIAGKVELFIQFESTCIFYYNLNSPQEKPAVDVQLVSGFLSASNLFFDELKIGNSNQNAVFRIIRGNTEIRMRLGKQIHGTLIFQNLEGLDNTAYFELDQLLISLIDQFESVYVNELEEFITDGRYAFKGIDLFIQNEVQKMKAHIYSNYLQFILSHAINRNVKRKSSLALLKSINSLFGDSFLDFYTIYAELDAIWNKIAGFSFSHSTINTIVEKVNRLHSKLWALFQIPLVPIYSKEHYINQKLQNQTKKKRQKSKHP